MSNTIICGWFCSRHFLGHRSKWNFLSWPWSGFVFCVLIQFFCHRRRPLYPSPQSPSFCVSFLKKTYVHTMSHVVVVDIHKVHCHKRVVVCIWFLSYTMWLCIVQFYVFIYCAESKHIHFHYIRKIHSFAASRFVCVLISIWMMMMVAVLHRHIESWKYLLFIQLSQL